VTRSRAAGIAIVVALVAGASGTAAASDRPPADSPAAAWVAASAPAATHHVTRPAPLPACPGTTASPHFATPQAAMRYLARAWNHHDLDALCHVTDPEARRLLAAMHHEAVHLRLSKCDYMTVGLYACTFRHDYPRHLHQTGVGHAFIEVAAARTPGWYSNGAVGCG